MIKNKRKIDKCFSFDSVTYDDILKKQVILTLLKHLKNDIPTKILKQNSDYFAECFCRNINQCISKSIFPPELKLADVTPVYKKKSKNSKDNYRSVSYKFMKEAFMIEFRFSLILFFPNISVGFEEATMHNTA